MEPDEATIAAAIELMRSRETAEGRELGRKGVAIARLTKEDREFFSWAPRPFGIKLPKGLRIGDLVHVSRDGKITPLGRKAGPEYVGGICDAAARLQILYPKK